MHAAAQNANYRALQKVWECLKSHLTQMAERMNAYLFVKPVASK